MVRKRKLEDPNVRTMRLAIAAAARGLNEAYRRYFPAKGKSKNSDPAERNITVGLAHQLMRRGAKVWAEVERNQQNKPKVGRKHLDLLALTTKNVLWLIEAKRLFNSSGADALVDDYHRVKGWRPLWPRQSFVGIPRYGLLVATIWSDDGLKGTTWWSDPDPDGDSGSWRRLTRILKKADVCKVAPKPFWRDEADPQVGYLAWAAFKLM